MVSQDTIKFAPHGHGASDITELIGSVIKDSNIKVGSCQLFAHSNQSSLFIHDTADEITKQQTVDFLAQLAPSSDTSCKTIDECMNSIPESMYAAITQTTVAFPVSRGRPLLGIWQGIYLWEKSTKPEERKITITIIGD